MNKRKPVTVTALFLAACMAFLAVTPVSGRAADPDSAVFHPSFGSVVDRDENARYFIFGDTAFFIAARMHRVSDTRVDIHAIRDSAGVIQLAVLKLDKIGFDKLERGIAARILPGDSGAGRPNRFNQPLILIRKSEWEKRTGTLKWILRDGSRIVGALTAARPDTLSIRTPGGLSIDIPDSQIESVAALPGVAAKRGRYLEKDPNGSRLLFAPTGRNLEAGQGYFADYFIFFPTVAVGVTRYFSVSGGMSIVPGAKQQLYYFAPKLTFRPSPDLGFGAGVLILGIPEEEDVKLGFAVSTIGGEQRAVTFGAGIPMGEGGGGHALLLIGGEMQMSARSKFITENWIFTGGDGFAAFSGGVRFFGERLAVDLALITAKDLLESGGFPFIPWVDFSVVFGHGS
ncbi:hypothetical protein JW777_04350 [bacterium]|nr:hypothetical protein [bacterium]